MLGSGVCNQSMWRLSNIIWKKLNGSYLPIQLRCKEGLMQVTTHSHLAAWQDQPAIMQLLLQSGANVDAKGEGGNTPLHYVAKNGALEAAKILINWRANIDAQNASGETPVVVATHGETPECLEVGRLLVDHGAKLDLVSAVRLGLVQEVRELLRSGVGKTAESDDPGSLLNAAIGTESAEIVRALLESGIDPKETPSSGRPPIFLAAELAIQSGSMEIVQLLLRYGADPGSKNEHGESVDKWINRFGSSKELPPKMAQAKQQLHNILVTISREHHNNRATGE